MSSKVWTKTEQNPIVVLLHYGTTVTVLQFYEPENLVDAPCMPIRFQNLNTLKIGNYSNCLSDIFTNESLKELLKLEIMTKVHDCELEIIALNCPKLKYLRLTNLENISNHGIRFVINNCKNIEELHLSGMEPVNKWTISEQCLYDIYNENVPKLRLLNLNSGPEISDTFLEELIDQIKHLKIRNAENKRVECKKWRRTLK